MFIFLSVNDSSSISSMAEVRIHRPTRPRGAVSSVSRIIVRGHGPLYLYCQVICWSAQFHTSNIISLLPSCHSVIAPRTWLVDGLLLLLLQSTLFAYFGTYDFDSDNITTWCQDLIDTIATPHCRLHPFMENGERQLLFTFLGLQIYPLGQDIMCNRTIFPVSAMSG